MSVLNVGDVIRGNGRRALGREVLKIVDLDGQYAYGQVPGHEQVTGENLIRIGRKHIHTDGLEREFGWDRISRAFKLSELGRAPNRQVAAP